MQMTREKFVKAKTPPRHPTAYVRRTRAMGTGGKAAHQRVRGVPSTVRLAHFGDSAGTSAERRSPKQEARLSEGIWLGIEL